MQHLLPVHTKQLFNMLLYFKALEPTDRKSLTNVTRWFTTCINQPQFLKVLGKISLCEKMVPVTPKTNAAPETKVANGGPTAEAAGTQANGEEGRDYG